VIEKLGNGVVTQHMTTPSTKALFGLAAVFLFFISVSVPEPRRIAVTGPDGSVVHRENGQVLSDQDMIQWKKDIIPLKVFFTCFCLCIVWLVVRSFRFLYNRHVLCKEHANNSKK
jgi:hypothetical protein